MAIREADDIQLGPWGKDGGVRYDLPAEDMLATEIASMENIHISAAGAAETRKGSASYKAAAAIATNPSLTLAAQFEANPATTHTMIIAGSVIYKYSSGWSDITGGLTVTAADDNTFEWCDANGTLYAINGADVPIKWTGTGNAAAAGISARFSDAEHIAFWDNRVWYANADTTYDRVWYTDTGSHDTIGATSFRNFGSSITGLKASKDFLAIHCKNGIHTLRPTGNTDIPYQQVQMTSRATVGGRSIIALPNDDQIFPRDDGMYRWDGGEAAEKISHSLDLGYWPNVNSSRLPFSHAVYYPAESESWFWLPKDSDTNNSEIMIYSDRHEKWFGPYTGTGTYFERNCSALIDKKPHAGTYNGSGSIGGKLEDHVPASTYVDDDNSAVGTAIQHHFRTAAPAPSSSAERLRWRYARTYYDSVGNYNIGVTQESSGVTGTSEVLQTTGGFALGTDLMDVGDLGTVRMLSQDTELSEYDPHSSLKFSNTTLGQFFRIRRTHLVYTPIGHKRKRQAGVE
jgi:hypothetical protein